MVKVIGVRFKKAGKVYYFDPGEYDIKKEDAVIVETVRGIEYGFVVVGPKEVPEQELVSPLKPVVRIADAHDQAVHAENVIKSKEAFDVCSEKIREHNLDMKLIEVEYTFDNNKVIFYFTADGRVDFRELVKDLAAVFRTRIELRQIGVRDEAKMMNGIGPCGYKLCCATWLGDFVPVSIKMAKDQSLSLNPTKISGICGRLMCCLRYEYDTYRELNKELPKSGERVQTPDGMAVVYSTSILKEKVKVKLIVGKHKDTGADELSEDFHEYGNAVIIRSERKRGGKAERAAQEASEDGAEGEGLGEDFPLEALDEDMVKILEDSPEGAALLEAAEKNKRRNNSKRPDRDGGKGKFSNDRNKGDRGQGQGDRSQGDRGRQQGERAQGNRPQGDRPQGDRQQGNRQQGDKPQGERQQGDRQQNDRNRRDRNRRNKRPLGVQLEDQDDAVFKNAADQPKSSKE